MIIRGGKVATPKGLVRADILIKAGKIEKIGRIEKHGDEEIIADGMLVLPGMIDGHVHLRDPGLTHKEDFYTGTCAALAGGVTTVIDMPNTVPPTISAAALKEKDECARNKAVCNYGFHFGASTDNFDEVRRVKPQSLKLFMGASTGNLLVPDLPTIYKHFVNFPREKPLLLHAESNELIEFFKPRFREHWKARNPLVALVAVDDAITLARYADRRVHICHVSTEGEIALLRQWKKATCEVAPHHLFMSSDDEKRMGNRSKMNPPVREPREVAKLWKSLGNVDMVATDHAPHTLDEKAQGAAGVPGLETCLPLLLDAVNRKKLTLGWVVQRYSENPARIYGIRKKGAIVKGNGADFAIVDMKEKWKVRGDELQTKCKWSPFEGMELKGKVKMAVLGGEIAYSDGEGVLLRPGKGKRVF